MKQKKPTKLKCECGREIIGFSEQHAEANLALHKNSKIHNEIMGAIKASSKSV